MHVFVQIPCLNEARTLPLVMEHMPKHIDGVDRLDVMIIDDGCTDDTVAVAKRSAYATSCATTARWDWPAPSATASTTR